MQTALAKQRSSAEPRLPVILGVFLVGIVLAALTSCGFSGSPTATQASAALRGTVHGGQQPVSGAKVQLYAAGTSGIGSAALPLLQDPVTSDSDGNFVIPATYVCPSASSQLYVVARGGNPGLPSGADNPSIALMTMLGACGTLPAATQISINEVTTVGSIWPLASYMTSATDIGAAAGDTAFAAAVATVNEFVSIDQGISPGISTADSYFTQNAKLYSLADVLDKCVNSAGGQAGDGSPCGVLFSMAASSGGAAPKDTIASAVRIAQNPYKEVANLFDLTAAPSAFQPALTTSPQDWTLTLSHPVAEPAISLPSGTYVGSQTLTIADKSAGSKIYYTTDGSKPTTASPLYLGSFSINVTSTVQAIAAVGSSQSSVASSTITVTATPAPTAPATQLVFLQQPSNTSIGTVISPAIKVAVEDARGNVITSATNLVQVNLAGGASLGGTLQIAATQGVATFSNLSVGTAGGYTLIASSPGLNSATSAIFTITAPVGITSNPGSGATYYMAPPAAGGNDSNNGTSATTPWLTPNHQGLQCGDTIIAAPGNYNAMTITTTPGCSTHNAVWVRCASFDTCKINQAVSSQGGIDVQASYWAFLGWEVTATSGPWASCFAATPSSGATSPIHDIYFINDIANGCMAGGIVSAPAGAGVDYFVAIADIIYNSAQGSAYCYSGVSVLEPEATDTLPGTHIFVSQIFTWDNVEPAICNGTKSTDGEGVIFDTFNDAYGTAPPYAQQAVIDNVLAVYNGAAGILEGGAGNSNSHIYIRNSTAYGNFINTNQNTSLCGQIQSVGFPSFPANENKFTEIYNNISSVSGGTAPGCGSSPAYAFMLGNIDSTTALYNNVGFSPAGNNVGLFGTTTGFAQGPNNVFGTNPNFANPVMPSAPSCGGSTSVINCMATVIANFTPTNSTLSTYGYRAPSGTQTYDPLFPQWLCGNPNMPKGVVTMGCSTQ